MAAGDTHLLGPNTNLNAFEAFRDDLPGPIASRSSPRAGTRAGPSSRPRSSASRLSHWAPTGNEVDLEFADFARYFADQPEVGVIAAYIEGFKDGRTLMLAADHAAAAGRADRVREGGPHRRGRARWPSPTPATSPAPTR